jgi:hypothetical protein
MLPLRPWNDAAVLGLLMYVMTNSLGGVQLPCCCLFFSSPAVTAIPSDWGASPLILTATHPPRGLSEVVAMWRREHTVFAVIAFIAAIMMFIVHWHRAGDVSQAKTEADCQKAGGMWDSKMNMCMEK